MLDADTQRLDGEILKFIRRYAGGPAPEASFEALAFKIFRYQFERNANYRKFCRMERKRPGELGSWRDIPAMPAVGFKELILAAFPLKNAVKKFRTSGTTQTARGVHLFDTLKLYEASMVPAFQSYLMPGQGSFSFYFLVATPAEAADSSLSHMLGVVNERFAKGCGKYYVKKGILLSEALAGDLKKSNGQAMILGTAFSLKAFLDFLQKKKLSLRLASGSRLMETGGFKGRTREISKPALVAQCRRWLGIERKFCVSEYGMTELSSQFYDSALRNRFRGPAWARVLIVDSRTGRPAPLGVAGLVCVVDLANRGSVLAVQTEDWGRRRGDAFELLGRARGSELRGCSLSYEEFLNV